MLEWQTLSILQMYGHVQNIDHAIHHIVFGTRLAIGGAGVRIFGALHTFSLSAADSP